MARDVISTGRSRTLILLIVDTPLCVYRVYTCVCCPAWARTCRLCTRPPMSEPEYVIKHDNDNAWIGDNPDRYLIGRLVGPIIRPCSLSPLPASISTILCSVREHLRRFDATEGILVSWIRTCDENFTREI